MPLLFALLFLCAVPCRANLVATFNSATDVPVTANGYTASGAFSATLNFAPPVGTTLMVVKNTGLPFISGTFSNLAQGQTVVLSYGGINYRFIANYYGGTGNDLVLVWAGRRLVAWGANDSGQLGNNSAMDRLVPTGVPSAGALAGKTVLAEAAGESHSLAVCTDGTIAAWGSNGLGQLGNNSTTSSVVPVAVNNSGVLAGKTVISVSAGNSHSLALCSDGTVAGWGENILGELGDNSQNRSSVPVAVDTTGVLVGKSVVAVASGSEHNLALCGDGTVVSWGVNTYGQLGNNASMTYSLAPVAVTTSGVLSEKAVTAIAAGSNHSLALCSDGTVVAWGDNTYGQLGNNSKTQSSVPVAVTTTGVLNGKTVVAVAAGQYFSLALCSDGTMATWGYNGHGELGNNTTTNSFVPVAVDLTGALSGKTVTAISAGEDYGMVFCSDASMAVWGYGGNGELGNDSTNSSSTPVAVSLNSLGIGEHYISAQSGPMADHCLGLIATTLSPMVSNPTSNGVTRTGAIINGTVDPNGSVTTAYFEYGPDTTYGSEANVTLTPNDGVGGQNVNVSLAGLPSGATYHYRLTATSAAGTASTSDGFFTTTFDLVATYQSAADVPYQSNGFLASGSTFSATLNFSPPVGTTLTVVRNTGPALISGTFSNLAQGQLVTLSYGGLSYQFIANYYGGAGKDLVLQWAKVRMASWGENDRGQLGVGDTFSRNLPTNVSTTGLLSGKTVVASAAGASHSLILYADGTLAACGSNSYGELANSSFGSNGSSTLVVANTLGALAGRRVISVTAGPNVSIALCSDGIVATWGSNDYDMLGRGGIRSVPANVDTSGVLSGKSVSAIAVGRAHVLALCSDGTVAGWGNDQNGQLGNSSKTYAPVPVAVNTAGILAGKTVVAIAAGNSSSMALCSDGTVATWGSNGYGELGIGNIATAKSLVPVAVNTAGVLAGRTVIAVAAGDSHSVALCSDGTIAAWGDGHYGQLGDGVTTTYSATPVAVKTDGVLAGKSIVRLVAGLNYTLVQCSDGTLAGWGDGGTGEIGNSFPTQYSVPVLVSTTVLAPGEKYSGIFAGSSGKHSLGLVASPLAPVSNTLGAENVTSSSAVLNGSVNAAAGSASITFSYGPTVSYGSTATSIPSTATGIIETAATASLAGLLPNTTYHYRIRAISAGGTTFGADMTFTTLADVSGPSGGTVGLAPGAAVDPGAAVTVNFAGWTDPTGPLTYAVLVDEVVVVAPGASAAPGFVAPMAVGAHTLKGRIYDGRGNFTEVAQSFSVNTAQESWRMRNFGAAQNAGNGADDADPDGDGFSNLFEYVAGLVPTDVGSRFNVRVDLVAGQPGQKAIVFSPVVAGRTYAVKYKASLTDATWTTLTDFATSDNGAERTVTDLSAGNGLRFYRVEIVLP